jgi:hypothetical protein
VGDLHGVDTKANDCYALLGGGYLHGIATCGGRRCAFLSLDAPQRVTMYGRKRVENSGYDDSEQEQGWSTIKRQYVGTF